MCGNRSQAPGVMLAILLTASFCLSACGRPGQTPILGAVTIELTATSSIYPTTVTPGGAVTVSAVVYDSYNAGVTWSVTPLDFGSLTNPTSTSVTFTAPASFSLPSTVTVTATSVTNPNVTAAVQLPASPIRVLLVAPASASTLFVNLPFADQTLPPGGSAMVQADIAYDSQAQGVTWSLSPPGAGSFQLLFNGPEPVHH